MASVLFKTTLGYILDNERLVLLSISLVNEFPVS